MSLLPLPADADPIRVAELGLRDPLANPLFERELAQRYLLFDAWVEGERRVNLHPLLLSPTLHAQAMAAAIAADALIDQVAGLALRDASEAQRYRFSPAVQRLAQAAHRAGDRSRLVRVDLLLSETGWQACEINADCPGGHNEALGLPKLAQAAGFFHGINPTTLVADLVQALLDLAGGRAAPSAEPGAIALIYATAYAEDLQVCALLQRELRRHGARAILAAPTALRRRGERLYIGDEPIAVLYRYFPTEFMEGQRNLDDILLAVKAGTLRCLSSFAAIYAQSKLAFARAFAQKDALPEPLRQALRVLPATYDLSDCSAQDLVNERERWVIKRALGRVGEEVFVGSLLSAPAWEQALQLARDDEEQGEAWVAQAFVPQRPIQSMYGRLFLTLGAYVLNGRFAGYFARLTPQSHTSHSALCLPVFVQAPSFTPAPAVDQNNQ
ncbi:MAG: glutathionylspermidine synthase family protein [Myxococcales bacterium]|nr:glutathionylspermidine synthase family protein [Myxococcales bacterium]